MSNVISMDKYRTPKFNGNKQDYAMACANEEARKYRLMGYDEITVSYKVRYFLSELSKSLGDFG